MEYTEKPHKSQTPVGESTTGLFSEVLELLLKINHMGLAEDAHISEVVPF